MTTTRTVNNTGAPLVKPDGTVMGNYYINFTLVTPQGVPTDTFDATTQERITGTATATTDANGIFTINLWPNSRGITATAYKVNISDANDTTTPGTVPFVAFLNEGTTALSWLDLKAGGVPIRPAQFDYIQSSLDNIVSQLVQDTSTVAAGNTLSPYTAVVSVGGSYLAADPTNMAHFGMVVGIVVDQQLNGGTPIIKQTGELHGSPWNQGPWYIGLNGALTQTIPDTAKWVQRVGVGNGATMVIVMYPPIALAQS